MHNPASKDVWLNAAECAERTGLTVRALRVYERHGLIGPRRSTSNWRLYGPAEIARLTEIIALKRFGLSLAEIARLLAGHPTDIHRLLDMQARSLVEKRGLAERALTIVGAMRDKLAAGAPLSVDELLRLVKETEMTDRSHDTIAWKRYEQARPRTETRIAALLCEAYAGHYLLEFGDGLTVTNNNGRLFLKVTGQPDVEMFAEADDRFFLKVVPAQIVFRRDDEDEVIGLELHQHGYEHLADRVDQSVVEAIEARLQERIRAKTPAPGGEALIRACVLDHQNGTIDYDRMTPPLAALAIEQSQAVRADLARLGALREVSFKGVNQDGWDVYDLRFDNGGVEWSFVLTDDGRFSGLLMRPAL